MGAEATVCLRWQAGGVLYQWRSCHRNALSLTGNGTPCYAGTRISLGQQPCSIHSAGILLASLTITHCMPESRTIFHFQDIPDGKHFDFQWQEQQAEASLASFRGQRAEIYLTGLKTLQVSVLNAASRLEIPVTWLHYDYDTEAYFPQNMDASIEMGNNHDKKHSASDGILP